MTGRKTSESYFAISSLQSPVCGLDAMRMALGAKRAHHTPNTLYPSSTWLLALDSRLSTLYSQRLAHSALRKASTPYTLSSAFRAYSLELRARNSGSGPFYSRLSTACCLLLPAFSAWRIALCAKRIHPTPYFHLGALCGSNVLTTLSPSKGIFARGPVYPIFSFSRQDRQACPEQSRRDRKEK